MRYDIIEDNVSYLKSFIFLSPGVVHKARTERSAEWQTGELWGLSCSHLNLSWLRVEWQKICIISLKWGTDNGVKSDYHNDLASAAPTHHRYLRMNAEGWRKQKLGWIESDWIWFDHFIKSNALAITLIAIQKKAIGVFLSSTVCIVRKGFGGISK